MNNDNNNTPKTPEQLRADPVCMHQYATNPAYYNDPLWRLLYDAGEALELLDMLRATPALDAMGVDVSDLEDTVARLKNVTNALVVRYKGVWPGWLSYTITT